MSEESKTKLVVIGAGPGGYAAAFLGADLGMEVTLIDRRKNPGGVCLYEGCIPSKALLHAAAVLNEAKHAGNFGIKFDAPKIDLDRLRSWKGEVVEKLTGGLGQLGKSRKLRYIQGSASFRDSHSLDVEVDGKTETVPFDFAIIATGSLPTKIPGLPESDRIMDSTGALDLKDIPKRLLVVGGGYIGLEMCTVYAALGSEVSVVEMAPSLLPGTDEDLVRPLAKRLGEVTKSIMLETKLAEVKADGKTLSVRFEGKQAPEGAQQFDRILLSIGRRPVTSGLGLDHTAVRVLDNGFIEVDDQRRTSERTIFAIGDVAGQPMLAHKASHEGRVAVEAIAGHKVAFEPYAIPAVVFTDPEIAYCGLTEAEAKRRNQTVKVARFPWAASGRSLSLDRTDGMTKLLIDPESERLLGVGIVGPGAGELIAECVLAIEMGALAKDVALSIHPHPTLSETIMESAEVFFGTSTHIYRPKS
ncbi:MAG: dihydrolipoyl dehydrogenase [Leptospiraceae bacterium]|nr:dihydrolipoyl dehydrogenase [Leptospiraceae bacterium]